MAEFIYNTEGYKMPVSYPDDVPSELNPKKVATEMMDNMWKGQTFSEDKFKECVIEVLQIFSEEYTDYVSSVMPAIDSFIENTHFPLSGLDLLWIAKDFQKAVKKRIKQDDLTQHAKKRLDYLINKGEE